MKEKKVKWLLRIFIEVDEYREEVGTFGYYNLQGVIDAIDVPRRTLYNNLGKKTALKKFDPEGKNVFFILTQN